MSLTHNDPKLKEKRRALRRNRTDAEKALWARLRNRRFYGVKFFRQYSIGAYILDFYSPSLKTAIEVDGGQHSEDRRQGRDATRTNRLRTHGITVLRFWNNDVILNIEGVLDDMAEKLTPPASPLAKGRSKD